MFRARHSCGPIGLDIGARGVRAVQAARRGDRMELLAAASAPLEAGADAPAVRQALDRILPRRFRGKRAAVALPPDSCEVRSIRLPQMPEAELRAAAEYEARERFPHLKNGWELGVLPAGAIGRASDSQQEVIVIAAAASAIAARMELVMALGLTVVALEPAMLSIFRPFAGLPAEDETARVLIDMGRCDTRIVISRGPSPVFLKSCPVGRDQLNEIAARELGVTAAEASAARRGSSEPARGEELAAAFRPALEQLGKEIGLCLRYYAVTFRGQRPDTLGLVGEDADCPVLRAGLAAVTQLPVEPVDPFAGWAVRDAAAPQGESCRAAWVTAAGLAMREPELAPAEVAAGA